MKSRKTYSGEAKLTEPHQIFVFGSNTQGRHGLGSALTARTLYGATYGKSKGRQGRSYAIVTKDISKKPYGLYSSNKIIDQIALFYEYAEKHPELEFLVCYTTLMPNLNGYNSNDLAKMFIKAIGRTEMITIPDNVVFNEEFLKLML